MCPSKANDIDIKELEIMKSFFHYWDHLTNFKELDEESAKLIEQDVRLAIIDILALGIPDKDPMTENPKRRHVLNARELLDAVNDRMYEEIKKSNLYFHLQKLEDAGLVKVVDQIPKGKQYITYYGRTAKAFPYPDDHKKKEVIGERIDQDIILKLLDRIHGEESSEEHKIIVDTAFKHYNRKFSKEKLPEWLDKYQEDVLELEIDIRKLFDLFDILRKFDQETVLAMREIALLLDVPGILDEKESEYSS